jgi:hypothetical protein
MAGRIDTVAAVKASFCAPRNPAVEVPSPPQGVIALPVRRSATTVAAACQQLRCRHGPTTFPDSPPDRLRDEPGWSKIEPKQRTC